MNHWAYLAVWILAGCTPQNPPVEGPCPELPFRHEVTGSLEQELDQAMRADGVAATAPQAAYTADTLQYSYIFTTEKLIHQTEDILLFRRPEDLPADSALKKVESQLQIDWSKEALVTILEFPGQHFYRYGIKGDELILYAGRPVPCDGYKDEIGSLYAYREAVRIYRVPGVTRASIKSFTKTYRFNSVSPENRCQRKLAIVGGGGRPSVIEEMGRYHMWFEGFSAATGVLFGSFSDDGERWDPAGWSTEQKGHFDKHSEYTDHYSPSVLATDDGYWIYYKDIRRTPSGSSRDSSAVARATSKDGVHWQDERIVLEPGKAGEWDSSWIYSSFVTKHDGKYWLWYSASDRAEGPVSIGLATSPDGLSFERSPENPVFRPGELGSFDDLGVTGPEVQVKNGTFHLWYTGLSGGGSAITAARGYIGLASSTDGAHWTRSSRPLLGPTDESEGQAVMGPSALLKEDAALLWYTGLNKAHEPVISLARCPLPKAR